MPRKHQEVIIQEEQPEVVTVVESEPLFEAEAYGTPQPDAGSDVTVMKQVGIGGPVPIVAPKHNTIQLQPIVVPLAVVPYMTQDSNVLRTDTRAAGGYESGDDGYREATEFNTVERERSETRKKKKSPAPRIFTLVTLVITALFIIPFLISCKFDNIGAMQIKAFDVIGLIKGWVDTKFSLSGDNAIGLAYIIIMMLAGVQLILSAIGLIIGKYPKPIAPILSFINMGAFIGLLVYFIVKKRFIVGDQVGFLVLLVLSILNFIISLVFSILLNSLEDRAEQRQKKGAEI